MGLQLLRRLIPKQSLRQAAASANANGTAVDTLGQEDVLVAIFTGTIAGTISALNLVVEESDTSGGTYTPISGATIDVAAMSDDDEAVISINMRKGARKRWIRCATAAYAGSGNFTLEAHVLLGNQNHEVTDSEHGGSAVLAEVN